MLYCMARNVVVRSMLNSTVVASNVVVVGRRFFKKVNVLRGPDPTRGKAGVLVLSPGGIRTSTSTVEQELYVIMVLVVPS